VVILVRDRGKPTVSVERLRHVLDEFALHGLGIEWPSEIAMPQSANIANVAEYAGVDHFGGVGVQHAVVPLMAYRKQTIALFRGADHLLALRDVPGHQLF